MKSFKYIFSVTLSCVMFNFSLHAYTPCTTRENIDKKKEAIIRYCKKGTFIDYGLATVLSGLSVYFSYKLYRYWTAREDNGEGLALDNEKLTKKLSDLERKFDKHKEPSLLTKRWFTSTFKSAITSFFYSSLAGLGIKLFDKFYKRYHCFDNLTDFVANRFGEMNALEELLYNAQLFDQYLKNSKKEIQKGRERFVVSMANLVDMLEYVVAFMEYKFDSFEDGILTEEDINLSKHLFDCMNDYCSKVNNFLKDESMDTLFMISSEFREEVTRIIESFKGFENRMIWLFG